MECIQPIVHPVPQIIHTILKIKRYVHRIVQLIITHLITNV
jgi:hypothetical protein